MVVAQNPKLGYDRADIRGRDTSTSCCFALFLVLFFFVLFLVLVFFFLFLFVVVLSIFIRQLKDRHTKEAIV
jgi:uncharacterized membrane protein YhaH (DUF805 family)